MDRSNLPRFSAEASLGASVRRARTAVVPSGRRPSGNVVPSVRTSSPMCRYLAGRCAGGDGQACSWLFANC